MVPSALSLTIALMSGKRPDPGTRLTAHLLVGGATAVVVGRKTGGLGGLLAGAAAVIAHEELDAPIADLLAELGS